jgi:hypothetical protein
MPVAGSNDSGVRWDSVVVPRKAVAGAPPRVAATAVGRSSGSIHVHVQLFGTLAALGAERSIRVELPACTRISEVLARVEQRLGAPLLVHLLDERGGKRRHCRLFVDGYPVEDVHDPLDGRSGWTEIDIILLIAPEGG